MRFLVAAMLLVVAGCGSSPAPGAPGPASPGPASPGPALADTPCMAVVDRGPLPAWARTGFTEPDPVEPHVVGRSCEIAAILFGDPLSSPPSADHTNKIPWAARQPSVAAATLGISAQRMDATTRVGAPVGRSVEGGPGPSIIDLPEPACWRLSLGWADRTDTLVLAYNAPT